MNTGLAMAGKLVLLLMYLCMLKYPKFSQDMAVCNGMILKTYPQITGIKNKRTFLSQSIDSPMSNRKYIHLHLSSWKHCTLVHLNGKRIQTDITIGKTDIDWGILNQGSKNLALAICKELYPGHENDLHEKFLKDYIKIERLRHHRSERGHYRILPIC